MNIKVINNCLCVYLDDLHEAPAVSILRTLDDGFTNSQDLNHLGSKVTTNTPQAKLTVLHICIQQHMFTNNPGNNNEDDECNLSYTVRI